MQISTTTDTVGKEAGLVIPVIQNEKLSEVLTSIGQQFDLDSQLLALDFRANEKELLSIQGNTPSGKQRIFLLGLGTSSDFNKVFGTSRHFIHKYQQKLPLQLEVSLTLGNVSETELSRVVEAISNGFCFGEYKIGRFKTDDSISTPVETAVNILVPAASLKDAKAAASRGQSFANTQLEILKLVNAPSNYKNPIDLSNWALSSGKKHGFEVRVMEKEEIVKEGLHGLLAVNRGSEFPATFTIMEYKPTGKILKKVGLVGKGVTFDTGGLSIKPSSNMHFMKSDMGGAAAVFGTMEMASKLALPIHLIGIVPATDNSVDGLAIKPSDVISSYSGKSIEVIDTDAEGRLILADGLSYMVHNYQPEVLIDLATLTGSVIRSLGYLAGGLFSNNDSLVDELIQAGERSGERLWSFPMWSEFGEMIRSDIADVKNFSGKPTAGAITAAKFLEHFIDDHECWAHLDIAGVAMADTGMSLQKSATAFGIRLLINFLENINE